MDSSDGLAWSLHELSRLSSVGFVLDSVPVASEAADFGKLNGLDASELALYGGEEYELVLTVKPEKLTEAKAAVDAVGGCLIPIGKATAEHEVVLEVAGKKRVIEARGWEHFKSQI
jgi:Thiamine monophosphate kinase